MTPEIVVLLGPASTMTEQELAAKLRAHFFVEQFCLLTATIKGTDEPAKQVEALSEHLAGEYPYAYMRVAVVGDPGYEPNTVRDLADVQTNTDAKLFYLKNRGTAAADSLVDILRLNCDGPRN